MNLELLLRHSLSYESNLPLHYQLGQIIRRLIDSGEIGPSDMIPTEEELCVAYQVSRSTVRQALKALVDEGLLVRVRGKGTFASEQKLRRRMENVYSFTHEMEAADKIPSSRIVVFRRIKPQPDVARILFSTDNDIDEVYYIIRIRLADSIPLLMETVFIPAKTIPDLTEEKLQGHSLYDILRDEAGVVPVHAEESYESIIIEKGICALLECPKNTTGFYIERHAYNKKGDIYELTQSIMRGDLCKLVISLKQGNYSVNKQYSKLDDNI